MRVAFVSPLPPARSGPAPYLAGLLPALSERMELTLCVPDVEAVEPALRARYDVRGLDARLDGHDLVVYALANNPWHAEVLDAAMAGPPGMVVVHDASLHHLQAGLTLDSGDHDGYAARLADAHGEVGRELAGLARVAPSGPLALERFVFDALAAVLDRHLGAQVHSHYAADVVRRRSPGLPVHVVPLRAPAPVAPAERSSLGIPLGRTVLGHAGFVTAPKRYDVLVAAAAALVAGGQDVHLLLAGEDGTHGDLDRTVAAHGMTDRVTVTGWQGDEEFDRAVAAFDVAVSLRWPHVGESSATLAALLAQGIPVVAEPIGSWGEMPHDVVRRAHLIDDPVGGLVDALRPLVADPAERRAWGARARDHAVTHLALERVVESFVAACEDVAARPLPAGEVRRAAAERVASRVARDPRLAGLPPASPGQRLLVTGAPVEVLEALPAWGYEVCEGLPRLLETGTVHAVSAWQPMSPALLLEVHRVLAPGGHLHGPALPADVPSYGLRWVGPGVARKTGPVTAPVPLLAG